MLRNEKLAETIKLDILEVNKHDVNQRKTVSLFISLGTLILNSR